MYNYLNSTKNPENPFVDIVTKCVPNFRKNILTSVVHVKVLNFSDKKPGFSKTIELCLIFAKWDFALPY